MKIPIEWLREYVEFEATLEELADRLTFCGHEVESIETVCSESVLDIEVTPNRPDCLSIIGIAREVAALYGSKLKLPSVDFHEKGQPVEDLTGVEVSDPKGCPRYTARVLMDATIGESPEWIRKRLIQCGMKPINNVVDITNYVLLECGHPLHAFDKSLLKEERIVVRRARLGENMATLDGVERKLTQDMLVIADAENSVAVAGVMGGAGSEIRDSTRTVLLESAYFKPADIRRTSKTLELSTESSFRFERGTDIGRVDWASRRAAALLVEFAGAKAARGVIDIFPKKPRAMEIKCRFNRVRSLLGIDITNDRMVEIFESLELPVVKRTRGACVVRVPTFRVDLEKEIDLIEEVARIHGMDKVPDDRPRAEIVPDACDAPLRAIFACRANLVALGLTEIMNYSFVSEELLDMFDQGDSTRRITLLNPNSTSQNTLRLTLLPQMVESLGKNMARQIMDASFFEIGRIFFKDENGDSYEEERVSIGLMGKPGYTPLDRRQPVAPEKMFLWLKGIIHALSSAQHLDSVKLIPVAHPFFEEGWAVSIVSGQPCGVMGLVREPIRRKWRMFEPVAVAEVAMKPLLAHFFDAPVLHPAPVYPAVTRDMAIIVDENITHENILKIIRKKAPKELTSIDLFDIFRDEAIGGARKSLAYSFVYRSVEKTLTDEDANRYHEIIKDALKSELKVEIRES